MDENPTKKSTRHIPTLPSRHFIENVDSLRKEGDLSCATIGKLNYLSDEENIEYFLYKFVESLIVILGELRYEAECYADKIREQINFRLDGSMPLNWVNVVKSFIPESEPPMELIVQIATGYRSNLFKLAASPRKILRQFHQKEHLSRVQRIDTRCLMWLTRQSGRDTLEKAGSRQQILSVVRKETHDTLENRVLKRMIELSCNKSFDYFRRYRSKFEDTPRLKMVRLFALETKKILRDERFNEIGLLLRSPKPNYVLMFDARYRDMWNWYSRMVHQQEETEAAWSWQSRLFSDWCRVAVTVGIWGFQGHKNLFKHELWIRNMPQKGIWLESLDWPSTMLIKTDGKSWLVDLDHDGENQADLNNDFTARIMRIRCSRPNGKKKIIDVYSYHKPGSYNETEQNNFCQDIKKNIKDSGIILYSRIQHRNFENPVFIGKIGMLFVNGQDAEMVKHTTEQIIKAIERLLTYE